VADGHLAPYDIHYFELGNEQYNSNWVHQVAAMEDKAKALGMGGDLFYMFPTNEGLNAADAKLAMDLGLPIDHIMPDIHIGTGGAIEVGINDFNRMPNFLQSAINCETNAETHNHRRALQEAADLNEWFNLDQALSSRFKARTASFCNERSGHFDGFDQGISFFLPNMTWLQPPGYVHQMISKTWLPRGIGFDATLASGQSISSQISADGKTLVVRFVNQDAAGKISITIDGSFKALNSVTVWTLVGALMDANTPGNPTKISPMQTTQNFVNGQVFSILPNSYTIIQFSSA